VVWYPDAGRSNVVVWLGWCGIRMQAEATLWFGWGGVVSGCRQKQRCDLAGVVWYPDAGRSNVVIWLGWYGIRMQAEATLWFGWGGVVSVCRLKQCFSLHTDTTPPQPNHNITPTRIEPEQYNP